MFYENVKVFHFVQLNLKNKKADTITCFILHVAVMASYWTMHVCKHEINIRKLGIIIQFIVFPSKDLWT